MSDFQENVLIFKNLDRYRISLVVHRYFFYSCRSPICRALDRPVSWFIPKFLCWRISLYRTFITNIRLIWLLVLPLLLLTFQTFVIMVLFSTQRRLFILSLVPFRLLLFLLFFSFFRLGWVRREMLKSTIIFEWNLIQTAILSLHHSICDVAFLFVIYFVMRK